MTRLRQVALAARSLGAAAAELTAAVPALSAPFADAGVAEFGLENAVFALGDTFLEIVAPLDPDGDTAAGRYLAKRGVEAGGYMALFQVDDTPRARARLADLGMRVVWQEDLPDISGTHVHPRDIGGAIVSLDTPTPPSSWRWGGPDWTGGAPAFDAACGIRGMTVACADPPAVAARWAAALGEEVGGGAASLVLDGGRQRIDFVDGDGAEAITAVALAVPGPLLLPLG